MKFFALVLLLLCFVVSIHCQESESDKDKDNDKSWWSNFKERIKTVLSKWKEDIKLLWDDVLAKADDMKGWTSDMFDSFKRKLKEWLETRSEVPDDDRNEIENFINKLKVPTDEPSKSPSKQIDP